MTIPSRPAPAPPQQQQSSQHNSTNSFNLPIKLPPPPASIHRAAPSSSANVQNGGSSITRHFPSARYAPTTNWDGSPFDPPHATATNVKKIPPPRPPPPRVVPTVNGNTVLKKPGPPQSINMLSNLFGRKKGHTKANKSQPTASQQKNFNPLDTNPFPTGLQTNNNRFTPPQTPASLINIKTTGESTDVELIKFDSPSSSPTFTQKSNSDCVSVDSFSSDSNFSSPQNGSVSQPESGFEDDFLSPSEPWDPFSNIGSSASSTASASRNYGFLNDIRVTQPVRNLSAISRGQNENPLCNGKSLLPSPETLTMPTIIKPKATVFSSSNTLSPLRVGNNFNTQMPSMLLTAKNVDNTFANFDGYQTTFEDHESSPPMPSCPPPPPPSSSMLDVISGRLDAINLCSNGEDSVSYGIALYDFEGVEDGDLNFKENEKVYLMQRLNDEWYLGRNKRGCEGIFPSNYIEIKVPLKEDAASSRSNSRNSISPAPALDSQNKVRVLYNFNAEMPEDLTLKENDLVTVLYRMNDEWLFGELNNKRGQFPANFLEYIPENLPNTMP